MRILMLGLFCLFNSYFAFAAMVDSVRTIVTPVQCYGLRNGMIHVDTVFGGEKPYFYSIDGQSFTTNPTFDHLFAGEYTLYVRDASGDTNDWTIVVKEPAALQVKLQASDELINSGQPFTLRALVNVEKEFLEAIEWQPEDLFARQDTLRHTLSISESTEFTVTVRDHHGCVAGDALSLDVQETHIYLPNVIKPGSASDAYFTVFSGEGVRRIVLLQVFNRSGAEVFERADFMPNAPLLGWGGRWDGKLVQTGVYPYLAVVELMDGKQLRYEGGVTVVY